MKYTDGGGSTSGVSLTSGSSSNFINTTFGIKQNDHAVDVKRGNDTWADKYPSYVTVYDVEKSAGAFLGYGTGGGGNSLIT